MRLGFIVALGAAALAMPATAPGVNIRECDGPGPANPYQETTGTGVHEGQRLRASLGIVCLPGDATVSATPIDWGDGTSSPPVVTYTPTSDGRRQAWIGGEHSYPRATSIPFRVRTTATCDQTGQTFDLVLNVEVAPTLDVLDPHAIRARAHGVYRGTLATIHTGGLRFAREITATIDWGDGHRSAARVSGSAQDFSFRGTHRWRAPGTYNVALRVHDAFTHERTIRYLRARVTRAGW